MVNKTRYQMIREEPPSMDESWWESVLAEEEARFTPPRASEAAYSTFRTANRSSCTDPIVVDWEEACRLYEQDEKVCLNVIGYNRGGLLVNGEGLQGFVPISHLVEAPPKEIESDEWLSSYTGRSMELKVIECDQERGRVVFSERAALSEPGIRNQLLHELCPGDSVVGTVTNITDFGVFVDLGGVEGLVHVSEISWGRVHHPGDAVFLGQSLSVYVIQVDQEHARVALSVKRLHPNPWETAEARYSPGQITDAVVTSVVSFGAFARLEEGLDGLIHISEFGLLDSRAHPGDILHEGQTIRVRILHVDGIRQRLGLSLRLDGSEI